MEIEFEGNKCWVQDASNVQLKRYLSKTRLYYRDGAYLREYFKALFPEIKSGPDGDLYYDLSTLEPEVVYSEAADLRKTKVPASEVKKIEKVLKTIRERMDQGNLSFNEEACVKEFTVPDPRIHPELYQLVFDDSGSMHFVILWALESTEPDANLNIDELLVVLHSDYMGEVAARTAKTSQEPPAAPVLEKEVQTSPAPTEEPAIEEPEEAKEELAVQEPEPVIETVDIQNTEEVVETPPQPEVETPVTSLPAIEPTPEEPEAVAPVPEVVEAPEPELASQSSSDTTNAEKSIPEPAPAPEEPKLTSRFGSVTRQIPTPAPSTPIQRTPVSEPRIEEPKKAVVQTKAPFQESAHTKSSAPTPQVKPEPKPIPAKKPVPIAERPAKLKPETAPRKPLDPEQKQKLIKIGILAASVLVALLLVREIMVGYLGRDVIITTASTHPSMSVLKVKPGDQVLLPQGKVFESFSSSTLLLAPIEKPGDYSITNLSEGSGKELLRIRYLNARNDFLDRPIASLQVMPTNINPGDRVEAKVAASFHKSANESIQSWSVTWGDGAGELTPITDPLIGATHSYEEPGSYRVSLIVRDNNNLWDEDNVIIEVVDPDDTETVPGAGNLPPVADAEILAIEDLKDGFLVKIALDHSFDPDGSIANLSVDWGDGSPVQQVDLLRSPVVEKRYAKALPRATVRVHAFDRDGERSRKPAILQLDFQSSALNDAKRFRQEVLPYTVERIPVGAKAGELVVQRRIFSNAIKNKLHQHWFLCNPVDQPGQPLRDVVWTIRDQKKILNVVNDTRELSLMLAAGRYTVEITAKDFEGNTLEFRQTFIVDPKPRMSGAVRFMNSIANGIPLPSLARMFI
jgi:hypothetical protein